MCCVLTFERGDQLVSIFNQLFDEAVCSIQLDLVTLSLSLKFGLSTKESLNSRVGNPMIRPEIKPLKTVQLGISSETLAHPCHHYHPYPHWNAQSVALLQRFMRKFLFTSALWTFIKPNFCSSQFEIMRLLLVTLDNTRKPAVACVLALLFTVQTLSLIR